MTVAGFAFSIVLTPLLRDLFRRVNVVDYPDQTRKRHSQPIPRAGGVALASSYAAALLLARWLPLTFDPAARNGVGVVVSLLPGASLIFAAGLIDDMIGLTARVKLAMQIMAAGLAYLGGVKIQILLNLPIQQAWNLPLTVIWLVGCTNAFNLIDGMDGLAAGVASLSTLTLAAAALTHGRLELALVTLPLVGCLLGFLPYNFNRASVFLGDSGSLLIGFLLGCYSVLSSQESATLLGLIAPLMAMTIPIFEVGLSISRRFLRGRPILGADRGHIHHVLLDRGLPPHRVVVVIYVSCTLTGGLSLLTDISPSQFSGLILLSFVAGALIGIQQLGYVEFRIARQIFTKGTFQRIIDDRSRLAEFEKAMAEASTRERRWELITACARDFAFVGISWAIEGHVFEELLEGADRGSCWQLRLPLPGHQSLQFEQRFSAKVSPVVIREFVNVIERTLSSGVETWKLEAVPLPKETVAAIGPSQRALAES